MERHCYDVQKWRDLPRNSCIIEILFGSAGGECGGLIHRHHVDKADPESRTFEVCQVHHPTVEAFLDKLLEASGGKWKPCPHKPGTHRYPGAKEECERKINAHLVAA